MGMGRYACRAGENDPYGGTGRLTDMGWFKGNNKIGNRPHPVGIKAANDFDIHDMHGNLLEWCKDVFNPEFYSAPDAKGPDAKGPDPICNTRRSKSTSSHTEWVCRGGSWDREAAACRSAFRFCNETDLVELGLRPAFYPLPPGL